MGERAGQIAKTPEVKQSNSNSRVRRTERLQSMDTPVDRILFLQRTAGNQAVSRLMKSRALQAKLRIGQTGDVYEQEADRVADAVMRMPEMQRQVDEEEEEDLIQTKPLVDQITLFVQRHVEEEEEKEEELIETKPLPNQITPLVQRQIQEQKEKEEEEILQTKKREGTTPEVTHDLESTINALKGGGQPLPVSVHAYFEPRFGYDFSGVRVHTDAKAAESARTLNARAYTVGRDVVLGEGQYMPGTLRGQRLIAHELTHVVQQDGLGHMIQRKQKNVPQRAGYFTVPEAIKYLEGIVWLFKFKAWQLKEKEHRKHPERFDKLRTNLRASLASDLLWLNGARMVLKDELNGDVKFEYKLKAAYQANIRWKLRAAADLQNKSVDEIYILYSDVIAPWTEQLGPASNVQVLASPEPISSRGLGELSKIAPAPVGAPFNEPPVAPERPTETSLSEIAAARARSMMLEHQESINATKKGTYVGSSYSQVSNGVQKIGCTDYIRWVLGYALWAKKQNRRIAYAGGNITDLIKELVTKKGWKAAPFAPNSTVKIRRYIPFTSYVKSTYEGVPVDPTMSVIDYVNNPTEKMKQRLNRLRRVPLAIIGAHHGYHAAFLIHGEVYEVHYSLGPDDPKLFEATRFEEWHGIWVREHGVLAMPPESWAVFLGTGSP